MSETKKAGSHDFPQRTRMSRIEYLRWSNELDRQKNPHLYARSPDGIGEKWLFLKNVAEMLGTTEDFVYRISRDELPAARVGKHNVYSREHVDAFLHKRLEASKPRHVAERKLRVNSNEMALENKSVAGSAFDPLATIRKLGVGR